MKLRWPTRYERTRSSLLIFALAFAFTEHPHKLTRDTAVICCVICFVAYFIAGLLKPLHDSTGEDA